MIYLDNAATTFQKPQCVHRAVQRALNEMTSPGRGGHKTARNAAETLYECREKSAKLFNVGEPERIAFTFNATHALNIAIKSTVKPGGRAVVSGYEHNSVTRPLYAAGVNVSVASSDMYDTKAALEAFERELSRGADACICTHVSNVFGNILPVEEISVMCRSKNIPFIIDASQSAGTLEIDYEKLGANFIAMPGHKGLYGPQGTGILVCGAEASPLIYGGTGSNSISPDMPDFLPDMLEAGTHNMPGIAGLRAGIDYVLKRSTAAIHKRESGLMSMMISGLRDIKNTAVYVPNGYERLSAAASFNIRGISSEIVAEELSARGIAVRAGLHCSPLAHKTAGTLETGTVRASVSDFTTVGSINSLLNAVEDISAKMSK